MQTKSAKLKQVLIFICLTIFSVGIVENNKAATNYYVSTSGSDSNNGLSLGTAFRNIQRANAFVVAGDVVYIADGTYTSTTITTTVNGTAANHITYRAINNRKAIVVITTGGDVSGWHNVGDYTTIDGIDISGTNSTLAVGIMNSGNDGRVLNCHVHNIKASACTGYGGAGIGWDQYNLKSGGVADGNLVHDIGDMGTDIADVFANRTNCFRVHGIYTSIANVTVTNNIVYRIIGYGYTNGHCGYNNVCVNNTFFSCGGTVEGGGAVLTNNVNCTSPSNNNKFCNNIIYDCVLGLHEEGTTSADNTLYSNNFIKGNATNIGSIPSGNTIVNPIAGVTPGFVNFQANGSGDYHLQSSSTCHDGGTATSAPSKDYEGNARPQGAGYDVGAYEYKLTTAVMETENASVIAVYPNPFSKNFVINISSETLLKDAVIKMYDLCGKEVKSVLMSSYETTVSRDELQSGIYFYNLINNNESISKGKLVIQ
jgi:hypothetical protein